MQIAERELLQAISDMMDEKLEKKLEEKLEEKLNEKLDAKLANMVTKDYLDERLSNMVTREELDEKLYNLENNVLSEIDTVQEKANNHFGRIERRLESLETTANSLKLESGTT